MLVLLVELYRASPVLLDHIVTVQHLVPALHVMPDRLLTPLLMLSVIFVLLVNILLLALLLAIAAYLVRALLAISFVVYVLMHLILFLPFLIYEGKYSANNGSAECSVCDAGKYSSLTGASNSSMCLDCPMGFYSNTGASTCQSCPTGTYASTVRTSVCTQCISGKYSSLMNSSVCLDCPVGFYSNTGASTCQSCPGGSYSNTTRSTTCTSCPFGWWSTLGSNSSSSCFPVDCVAPRYVGVSGQCMCGAGFYGRVVYSSGQLSGCSPCAYVSMWSAAGNGNTCFPIPCTPTTNYTDRFGTCMCNAGYFGIVKYVSGNLSGCVACTSSNLWSVAGNGRVCNGVSCSTSVGYVGSAGNCSCASGFTGNVTYLLGSVFGCTACAINKWSDTGMNKPCLNIPCSKAPGYEGVDGFCVCAAGYYEVSPVTYSSGYPVGCAKCPQGSFNSMPSSKSCELCPKGKYSSALGATNSSVCLDCPPGYYGDTYGLVTCSLCESGKFSESFSSSSCSLCKTGKYSTAAGATSSSTCLDCMAGIVVCVLKYIIMCINTQFMLFRYLQPELWGVQL